MGAVSIKTVPDSWLKVEHLSSLGNGALTVDAVGLSIYHTR